MSRQLADYGELIRWLAAKALGWYARPIAVVIALAIVSVLFEVLGLYLVAGILHASQSPAASAWAKWPVSVVAATAVLMVAALLTYLSRSYAIALQTRFTHRLADQIKTTLTDRIYEFDRGLLPFGLDAADVHRALVGDVGTCGVALKLTLLNAVAVFYLLGGLAIVATVAPVVLVLCIVALLATLPILYAVNLSAVRSAQTLAWVGPARNKALNAHMRAVLGTGQPATEAEAEDLQERFVAATNHRLLSVEQSKLVLAIMFAVAVGALLWLIQQPQMSSSFGIAHLFLLFVGFRFIFHGLQGLSVLVTTINRSLPSIIRVYGVFSKLGKFENRAAGMAKMPSELGQAEFEWRIELPEGKQQTGTFRQGEAYAIATPGRPSARAGSQIMSALASKKAQHRFLAAAGRDPLFVGGNEPVRAQADETAEQAAKPNADRATLDRPASRMLLANIARVSAMAPQIVFVDGDELLRLRSVSLEQALAPLSHHLVFVTGQNLDGMLEQTASFPVLVGTSKRIGFVVPRGANVDDVIRKTANAIFGNEQPNKKVAPEAKEDLETEDLDETVF